MSLFWSREENGRKGDEKSGQDHTRRQQWNGPGTPAFLVLCSDHEAMLHIWHLSLPLSPYKLSSKMGYLYVTVIFFGDEGDLNRKEVVGLPSNAELKAATLIFGINHWQAPLQGISSTVVSILAIKLPNNRCTNTRSVMRNIHVKLVVQSWKNSAKENQPQIWLCFSNSTHFHTVQEKTRFPNNLKKKTSWHPGSRAFPW